MFLFGSKIIWRWPEGVAKLSVCRGESGPEFQGGDSHFFLEDPAEMRLVFKPAFERDFADTQVGILQQLGGEGQPLLHYPARRTFVVYLPEFALEGGNAHAGQVRIVR